MSRLARYTEAAAELADLIESGEFDDTWIRSLLAGCRLRTEPPRPEEALDVLAGTDADSGDYVNACILRGDAHLLLGQVEAAHQAYQETITRARTTGSPDDWDVLEAAAWAQLKSGSPRDAVRMLVRALDRRRRPWLQFDLGLATLLTKPIRAAAEYRRGLAMTAELVDTELQRATLLVAAQDVCRALTVERLVDDSEVTVEIKDALAAAIRAMPPAPTAVADLVGTVLQDLEEDHRTGVGT